MRANAGQLKQMRAALTSLSYSTTVTVSESGIIWKIRGRCSPYVSRQYVESSLDSTRLIEHGTLFYNDRFAVLVADPSADVDVAVKILSGWIWPYAADIFHVLLPIARVWPLAESTGLPVFSWLPRDLRAVDVYSVRPLAGGWFCKRDCTVPVPELAKTAVEELNMAVDREFTQGSLRIGRLITERTPAWWLAFPRVYAGRLLNHILDREGYKSEDWELEPVCACSGEFMWSIDGRLGMKVVHPQHEEVKLPIENDGEHWVAWHVAPSNDGAVD